MVYNILQYLEESAAHFGDKTSFADEKNALTYEELLCNSRRAGSGILEKGISSGPVAVLMRKSPLCLCAYFGAVYAGGFYIPLDDAMPAARIQIILDTLSPSFVIYDSLNEKKLAELNLSCPCACIDELLNTEENDAALAEVRRRSISTDAVYALFTSGSTGVPKGVVVNHQSVIAYAEWMADTFGYDESTVFGNQTPFYFSMSVHDIYSTIRNACTFQIIPKKYFSFPGRLMDYLCDRGVNSIYWVPTAMCIAADADVFAKRRIPPLKRILFAGETMPTKQLNYWIRNIPDALYANLFGPTEITDIGVYYVVDRTFADDEPLPIGKPCLNCGCLVLTEDMREAAADEEGELCIRGAFLAMGYYNNPERTAGVFVQNPLNPHYPELIYKTGDIVKYNSHGELMFVGRKDFQIKHMGYRIELGEIEAAIGARDGVNKVCCIYDKAEDKIICFYVGSADEKELSAAANDKLPQYMRPAKYISLRSFPINPNGKIDRRRLESEQLDANKLI